MKRRDFFPAFGWGGYSLVVLAGNLPAREWDPQTRREMEETFQRVAPPESASRTSSAEPHMTLVELQCDLLVCGGGLAGVCAAISAARHGAKVILVQDRSRLGGNSSSEVKMHVVGANSHKGRPGWRESGLIEELRLEDAVNNPQRCWELWDLLLYDKVVSEPNITLLLESTVYAVTMREGKVESAMVRCDKSEHLYHIRAKLFCDCTGDSRLALEAGAEMRWGREARAEFNESLAPEKADRETLGSSILFTSRLYNKPMPFRPPKWARKVSKEHLRHRPTTSWEYGYWWIEWGGDLNPIRDNERIRFELLSIAMGVWDYIKNSGDLPGSSNWAMDWIGMMPGKRGSRRVMGDHILTEGDLMRGTFPDGVAIGGWPMDDHPPGGFDRPELPPNTVLRTPEVFNIPLRSLYSRNISNLMLAGRNISATHAAFTSTRVMATCAVIGQAVGTAAVQCLENNLSPRQLASSSQQVSRLQQTLLRDDQTIRDARNQDPADLAHSASVRASAEDPDAPARNVINGVARDIPKSPVQPQAVVNRWSAPLGSEGAWIELSWPKPQTVRHIQIAFDTGFQRELTLSSADFGIRTIVRAPQPETVRDYKVYGRIPGSAELKELAAVSGNYQRLNRHSFDPVAVEAIRLHVTATNGDERARVFEMRCYA
jgi:hypothetical protein